MLNLLFCRTSQLEPTCAWSLPVGETLWMHMHVIYIQCLTVVAWVKSGMGFGDLYKVVGAWRPKNPTTGHPSLRAGKYCLWDRSILNAEFSLIIELILRGWKTFWLPIALCVPLHSLMAGIRAARWWGTQQLIKLSFRRSGQPRPLTFAESVRSFPDLNWTCASPFSVKPLLLCPFRLFTFWTYYLIVRAWTQRASSSILWHKRTLIL